MDFKELTRTRQSCRKYDPELDVSREDLNEILEAARLAPSACNGQPYHITVCAGNIAKEAAKLVQGMGMNGFASSAPILLVISEEPYVKTAAFGAKVKNNDYRSIDIGILSAYITNRSAELGLGSCMLGWFDEAALMKLCHLSGRVRLVITVGHPVKDDPIRAKKRKELETLVTFLGDET